MQHHNKNQVYFYTGLSLALLAFSLFVLKSFLFGIMWGGLTALSMYPLMKYFKLMLKNAGLTVSDKQLAFGIIMIFLLVIVIPLTMAAFDLVKAYNQNQSLFSSSHGIDYPSFMQSLPYQAKIKPIWDEYIGHSKSWADALNKLSNGSLYKWIAVVWSELMDKLFTFFVMLISCYFILSNSEALIDKYDKAFTYWFGDKAKKVFDKGLAGLRGTINGIVLIGIAEGALLAIPLLLAGIPSALLIGVTAGILGVIPMVMPIIIAPFIGYLYFIGSYWLAAFAAINLVLSWLIFENVVKPKTIGQSVKINSLIILMAMVGGLQALGPVGLFLGPAVIAMAIILFKSLILEEEDPQ